MLKILEQRLESVNLVLQILVSEFPECSLLKAEEQGEYLDYMDRLFDIEQLTPAEIDILRCDWLKRHGVSRERKVSIDARRRTIYGRYINPDYTMSVVIQTVRAVMDGKLGKEAAKVLAAALNMGLLVKTPSFEMARSAFGMEGSKNAYENYKDGISAQEFKPYQQALSQKYNEIVGYPHFK